MNNAKPSSSFNQAKRAAILSATIFPGAGLFFLRHYVRGCIFAMPAIVVIIMLFKNLFDVAIKLNKELAAQAELGNYAIDFAYLWSSLHGSLFSSPYWEQGKWILLASWLLSIISSYFAGKRIDLATATH